MALCGDGVMKQCCYNVMFRRVAKGADKVEVEPQGVQISLKQSSSALVRDSRDFLLQTPVTFLGRFL